jgi:hypothetical protein
MSLRYLSRAVRLRVGDNFLDYLVKKERDKKLGVLLVAKRTGFELFRRLFSVKQCVVGQRNRPYFIFDRVFKGGIFLFDISSERKFLEKIANTVSVDDRDDVTYMSFNKAEEDGATMEVTLFAKRADGAYERLDETHRQYIYTEEEIIQVLESNGFVLLKTEGHLGEDKTQSDRICFLAQYKGGKR